MMIGASIMSREDDEQNKNVHLEWRDYVAIMIASLETTLLPIIVSVAVLILIVILLRW
jgi:hypothetical protein